MQNKGIAGTWKVVEQHKNILNALDSHGMKTQYSDKYNFKKNHIDKVERVSKPDDDRMSIELSIQKRKTIIRLITEQTLPDYIFKRLSKLKLIHDFHEEKYAL
ncbi:hypothetical protein ZU49_004440 [Salmonella enterica subsp. enterica]|nr:hypothetical protein [Salmonella enterica subsp. enterica serovar Muenchen]EDV5543752.1 hypothetical protein [Salmonella enterica subsp. enterica]HEC7519784.1 hypothetical protein [Salmonella enterica subsp. enterica serovar Muenchen]HEC7582287.1 hypothetical protein [Salmonella enterica subsp. enterica serovar Muenchen]HEC8371363.1 hypothetical protein [Salmonella enterica subsp. enterica serovar Muenchen]